MVIMSIVMIIALIVMKKKSPQTQGKVKSGRFRDLLIDSLVAKLLWNNLCVEIFHKNKLQRTLHFFGSIG